MGSKERNPAEVEQLQREFIECLLDAVRRSLGGSPAPKLLRIVTTMMSQSGLANVERACGDPQVVVCGGNQDLKYELRSAGTGVSANEPYTWDLELSVRKYGFEQCIICAGSLAETDAEDDGLPSACSIKSLVSKSCRVRCCYIQDSSGDERIELDVLDVSKELRILDTQGLPLKKLADVTARGEKQHHRGGIFSRLLMRVQRTTVVWAVMRIIRQCAQGFCKATSRLLLRVRKAFARLVYGSREARP